MGAGQRDEQVIVIDNDQGESGASAAWREGFQRLVSDVGHASLAPNAEITVFPWKDEAGLKARTINRARAFLKRHQAS